MASRWVGWSHLGGGATWCSVNFRVFGDRWGGEPLSLGRQTVPPGGSLLQSVQDAPNRGAHKVCNSPAPQAAGNGKGPCRQRCRASGRTGRPAGAAAPLGTAGGPSWPPSSGGRLWGGGGCWVAPPPFKRPILHMLNWVIVDESVKKKEEGRGGEEGEEGQVGTSCILHEHAGTEI